MNFPILYEDAYFVAAEKPAGLPSQATLDKSRPHFYALLQEQLGKETYLALHHRLDRDTSGVMIFAKTKEANLPLAELFKEHRIQKTYVALSRKHRCPEQWVVKNFLAEAPRTNKERARMIAVRAGGLPAETHFRLLENLSRGLVIEAQPKTGRMHQIRSHLSERGLGIFGDDLYASAQEPAAPRLMLHSHRLEFKHPWSGKSVLIESPLPRDMEAFKKKLS